MTGSCPAANCRGESGRSAQYAMAKTNQPKYGNFREAYCAYYRCRAQDFQKRAFFRAMGPFRRTLGLPIYWFNKPFFAMDFGIIDSVGDARTATEFDSAQEELMGITRVERSIRRGLLGIRISGPRLNAMWKRLSPYIEPPAEVALAEAVAVVPQTTISRRMVDGSPAPGDILTPHVIRKLRLAMEAVISGVPAAKAAEDAGFGRVADFTDALRNRAVSHEPSRWLLSQIELVARVRALEDEVAQGKNLIADQQMALSRLRSRDVPASPGPTE